MPTADRYSHEFFAADVQTDDHGKHLVVTHNLGRQFPAVAVWICPANVLMPDPRVVADSVNALRVYLNGPLPSNGSVRVRVVG